MNRCENHIIEDMNSACAYCSIEVLQDRLKESVRENAELQKALGLKLDAMPSGLSAGQSMALEGRLKELECAIQMLTDFLRKIESECQGHTEAGRLFSVEALKVATQAVKSKGV